MRFETEKIKFRARLAVAMIFIAAPAARSGDAESTASSEPVLNFKVPLENYTPTNEVQNAAPQIKTLLEGSKAQLQPGGLILISEAKLKTYSPTGEMEMQAVSPECVFDHDQKTVSSAGPLQVRSTDGKFLLEGDGFSLLQTNSDLFISNHVHTVIRGTSFPARKP